MHSEYDLHGGRPLFPEVASPFVRTTSRRMRARERERERERESPGRVTLPCHREREREREVVQHPMGDIPEPEEYRVNLKKIRLETRRERKRERRDLVSRTEIGREKEKIGEERGETEEARLSGRAWERVESIVTGCPC